MKTVRLSGGKAAGRVALVDDEDYELVSQYTWRVSEHLVSPTRLPWGPYAMTTIWDGRRYHGIQMHKLITGYPKTDHKDHNGLNNQRSNLRPATVTQNNANQRPRRGFSSQYKGVFRVKKSGMWRARIGLDYGNHRIGDFVSELQAAYAYDAAAREMFGEYACPNFPEGPTRAMRDEWQEETEARGAALAAEAARRQRALNAEMWEHRPHRTQVCIVCGEDYQCRSARESFYCSNKCWLRAYRRRERERQLEGRLF